MDKEQKITNDIKVPNKDLEVLKKHFSHCFDKNGSFDIEKFKQELAENEIDFYKESYSLDWLGKSYARLLASDSATTLLKENEEFSGKEENKNSENLLIKGDNLEVLKHLSNAYYEKIKMIYIDPPYNTGSDGFVYQDDRKFTVREFRQLAGVDEEKAKRILSFVDSKSNSHSAWLTFMYPRLYIAKQLLKDDGVIFISIDDNEVAQLRLLMDEVFGEENFVAEFIVRSNPRGSQSSKDIAIEHEYLISYSKNSDNNSIVGYAKDTEDKSDYNLIDENGVYRLLGLRQRGGAWKRADRPDMYYPIYVDTTKGDVSLIKSKQYHKEVLPKRPSGEESRWTWGKEKFEKDNYLLIGKKVRRDGESDFWDIFRKDYLYKDGEISRKKPRSIFDEKDMNYQNGGNEIKNLFGNSEIFKYPKPTFLLKKCISMLDLNNDLILDFFAGSGTTGDAVMQLNAEDGGNRKYILVQLPEKINPKKNKTAYDFVKDELGIDEPTIFEITKERLIRASKKIKKETIKTKIAEKEKEIKELDGQLDFGSKNEKIKQLKAEIEALKNQDLGFKIFETMPIWEDYNFEADELQSTFEFFDESKLTNDDLKALLVTWKTYDGISLTDSFQEIDLGNYTAYYTNNKLYLINKGFKTENLKSLLEKIDSDKKFNPTSIIAFGYNFESKNLREIAENIKSYANKKHIDIDFITRY